MTDTTITTSTTTTKLGFRYVCSNTSGSFSCDSGYGKPPRKKCRRCGSLFNVFSLWYGVFVWNAACQYPDSAVISLHTTIAAAQKRVDAPTNKGRNWVVRYVGQSLCRS